mgnify:CR=1 FL=1
MNKRMKKWIFCMMLAIAVIWGEKNILCPQSNVAAAENEDDKIQGTYGDNLMECSLFQEPEKYRLIFRESYKSRAMSSMLTE